MPYRKMSRPVRQSRFSFGARSSSCLLVQLAASLVNADLSTRGIGAVTAAQAIMTFSHPGRCRSDAAFAALSGTSPLQASSGKTVRHRLNRGGDRALNRAIHHRRDPHAVLPNDQGIRRPSHSRGQVQP